MKGKTVAQDLERVLMIRWLLSIRSNSEEEGPSHIKERISSKIASNAMMRASAAQYLTHRLRSGSEPEEATLNDAYAGYAYTVQRLVL